MVVLCQSPEAVRAHFEAHPVPYPVAIDSDRTVAKAYGVYRLLGFDSIHVARPATFVIDRAGIVRPGHAGQFQWQSLAIGKILRTLDGLSDQSAG